MDPQPNHYQRELQLATLLTPIIKDLSGNLQNLDQSLDIVNYLEVDVTESCLVEEKKDEEIELLQDLATKFLMQKRLLQFQLQTFQGLKEDYQKIVQSNVKEGGKFDVGDPKFLRKYFEFALNEKLDEFNQISDEKKFESDLRERKKKIWEHLNPGKRYIPIQDEDEDVIITSQMETFTCPITSTFMNDIIYTSNACNHSYSEVIMRILRSRNGQDECPVTGCNYLVKPSNLVRNYDMERRAKDYQRSQLEVEVDDEVDGVVTI
ncbi:hypothetical protein HK099_005645 [Clydaea vesicula]|uniref:SP-RING-type domain-containing protein n=1 Tax=Clydaea vesicula TaxID=447962 RepID=A0AAD5Y379_9FUNG|nr:hypothetical protein HK099_005645 [Clydaea vesicula]KAJ3390956.1 hypothetical protein HDU92_000208 [Lobulomyces angularis]